LPKLSVYVPATAAHPDDLLPIVDVHDATQAPSGTTKSITAARLLPVDWVSAVTKGADPSGTADSTTALGDAVTAAAAAGVPLYLPAGTYKITAALNWKIPGLHVITAGAAHTTIRQATDNTPILQLAGQGQRIGGLTLRYAAQQVAASTSAIAVEFGDDTAGSCFLSAFEDLRCYLANTGLAVNPAVTTAAGLFSCYFGNIEIFGYSVRAISLTGSNGGGANCTGCVFDNTYIHNNFTGSDAGSTSWPLFLQGWDEVVFNQLNIEHAQVFSSDACVFSQCGNVVINALHAEHLELSGTPGFGLVGVGTGTGTVQVNGLTVRFGTFTGASLNSVFRVTGGSGQNIICNGLNFPAGDGGDSTAAIAVADFNSAAGVSAQVTGINGTAAQLFTAYTANAGAGSQMAVTDGAQVTYSPPLGWTTFATGGMGNGLNASSGTATVPVAGTWYYADVFVPFTVTVTGLIAGCVSGGGTDKWIAAIWPRTGGAALAASAAAGTTTPSAADFALPFTAPVTLPGPAVYKAGVQSNGTAARIETFGNAAEGFAAGSQSGTFGTVPSLSSPSTSYTQNAGPMAKTY
jgi:hypothetical protein